MKKISAIILALLLVSSITPQAITVKNGGATFNFTNNTEEPIEGMFIGSMQRDGKAEQVKTGSLITIAPGMTASCTLPFENYTTGSDINGFFWSNLNQIIPLGNKLTLTSAAIDNTTYAGEYILAVNTDTEASLSTGTLPKSSNQQSSDIQISPPTEDGIYQQHIKQAFRLPTYSGRKHFSLNNINADINSASHQMGDTKSFVVTTNTGAYEEYSLEFVCKAVGEYCYIWVANEQIDKDGYSPMQDDETTPLTDLDIISDSMAQAFATEYDSVIYPLLLNNFGSMNNHDDDTKISLLFYDIQDGFNGNGSFIGGYFDSADLYSKEVASWATGNNTDMMHIDTFPLITHKGMTDACSTMAHELQHFVNHSWLEKSPYIDTFDDAKWTPFNEAMSMAAEHIYGGVQTSRINNYNQAGYSTQIAEGLTFLNWGVQDLADYSLSYLLGQYLRTQTQEFEGGGTAIFQNIMSEISSFDIIGVTGQINKVMYGSTVEKYISPEELITNFRLALILKDDYGPYGFRGEEAFDALNLPLYTGEGKILEAGGAVLIKNNNSFTPTVTDTNMKFFGISLSK